ncbi:MAG: GNAT family N-acetyltransferase [Anaerolineales bacterium]|nr:GNAT family N-acetyltransferase [Anaerolineales bacterium]
MSLPGPAYRIETERLLLRPWSPGDAPQLKAAIDASREHLSPWMPWAREEEPLQNYIDRLRTFRGNFDLGQDFVYGIFNRQGDQVLGSSGLHTRLGMRAREIGYWIHVDHINQGLASECAAALTRVAFEVEGMDRVEIHCDPRNLASAAVPRKLGYQHEATLGRRIFWSDDEVSDSMIWTLFAPQYPGSPAARVPFAAYDALGRQIV